MQLQTRLNLKLNKRKENLSGKLSKSMKQRTLLSWRILLYLIKNKIRGQLITLLILMKAWHKLIP